MIHRSSPAEPSNIVPVNSTTSTCGGEASVAASARLWPTFVSVFVAALGSSTVGYAIGFSSSALIDLAALPEDYALQKGSVISDLFAVSHGVTSGGSRGGGGGGGSMGDIRHLEYYTLARQRAGHRERQQGLGQTGMVWSALPCLCSTLSCLCPARPAAELAEVIDIIIVPCIIIYARLGAVYVYGSRDVTIALRNRFTGGRPFWSRGEEVRQGSRDI